MPLPRFDYGDSVRVIRNIRNDGTFPGVVTGKLLIRRGSVGFVRQIGTFLQDQIIYGVHFVDQGGRVVGCRETELIPADDPWVASQFEVRDRVRTRLALAIHGDVQVEQGTRGEVIEVLRDAPGGVMYHVRFGERILHVPEAALELSQGLEIL